MRWTLSGDVFDGRWEISPHVPVQLTAAACFTGLDPALDAVFRLIDGAGKWNAASGMTHAALVI